MCAYCGEFLVYIEGFQVRRATAEELREIGAGPRTTTLLEIAAKASREYWQKRKP